MAHLLHIRPWELDRLTVGEFESAIAWIEQEMTARTTT
jgi:hypothetical protein